VTDTTRRSGVYYDPYDVEIDDNPYPVWKHLRDEAPLYRNEEHDFWALSRYDDVIEGFRDSARFSSTHGVTLDPAASGPNAYKTMSLLALDPPRHGKMRALVSRGFTPRRVLDLEPRIRELSRQYIDAAIERGSFDFIGDFAGKLPMDVISELVGVPEPDRAELRRLADLLVHREEGINDVPPAGVAAALELVVYYADMIAQRRRERTDDLTSALLDAEIDGERLTDDEIIAFLFLMVVAGNETTTKLLGNAWYWAWRNPDQRAIPFTDRTRVPDWVEETLRFDTSSQMLARITVGDVELHGEALPPSSRVLLLVGSANRDPRVFPNPDRYDLDRAHDQQQIASFGFGRHYCLGASLARLEGRVALEELVDRVSDYDIDADGIARVHSINVRGFAALPTTVRAR
jgi:cytochrome P450